MIDCRSLKAQKYIPLLLIAAGLLVYYNSLQAPFIFDDLRHIGLNPRIRQLWPPWDIVLHTSRPVVLFSVAMNYALGGLNPWGYHAFNVGVHILAALILYGVARLTFLSGPLRSRFGDAAPWLACVVSLAWLVHPLQTEAVTYTIQRGESLMGLFYLLTLYCVIRGSGPSRSIGWQIGAVASCTLGMASKPIMVTAPVAILLYDRAFLARSWWDVMERRWKLYVGLAATWVLLPLLLANAPSEWKDSAGYATRGIPTVQYALTQPSVILHYLRLALWPDRLCFDYGWYYGWPAAQTVGDALPDLIVVGALLAGTVWAWRRQPALGFLGVWFFLILAPTSSFVPVADLVVEHRMYLPLAAVAAMVTVGGFVMGQNLPGTRPQARKIITCGVVGILVALLAIVTVRRNHDYRTESVLWQDTLAKCPHNPRAHDCLGLMLAQAGDIPGAIGHYQQALRIAPGYAEVHNNLGLALVQAGSVPEAVRHYEEALRLVPEYADAHNNLAVALYGLGRTTEALEQFRAAIRVNPEFTAAHNNLGLALLRSGDLAEAKEEFQRAVRIEPDYAEAHNNLGATLVRLGDLAEARKQFEEALRIAPGYGAAQRNLARLRAGQ